MRTLFNGSGWLLALGAASVFGLAMLTHWPMRLGAVGLVGAIAWAGLLLGLRVWGPRGLSRGGRVLLGIVQWLCAVGPGVSGLHGFLAEPASPAGLVDAALLYLAGPGVGLFVPWAVGLMVVALWLRARSAA